MHVEIRYVILVMGRQDSKCGCTQVGHICMHLPSRIRQERIMCSFIKASMCNRRGMARFIASCTLLEIRQSVFMGLLGEQQAVSAACTGLLWCAYMDLLRCSHTDSIV